MTFSGWVATLAGWYVTEIGRQPWLVYGVLRTADAASDVAGADDRHQPGGCTWRSTWSCCWPTSAVLFYLARKARQAADRKPADAPTVQEADDDRDRTGCR